MLKKVKKKIKNNEGTNNFKIMLSELYYMKYLKTNKAKWHFIIQETQEPELFLCSGKFKLKFS